jgi:hypothetical protein
MARKYPHAVVPGYTHLRRAQPVLWQHYLLAYFEMFWRDAERFSEARRRSQVLVRPSRALPPIGNWICALTFSADPHPAPKVFTTLMSLARLGGSSQTVLAYRRDSKPQIATTLHRPQDFPQPRRGVRLLAAERAE